MGFSPIEYKTEQNGDASRRAVRPIRAVGRGRSIKIEPVIDQRAVGGRRGLDNVRERKTLQTMVSVDIPYRGFFNPWGEPECSGI